MKTTSRIVYALVLSAFSFLCAFNLLAETDTGLAPEVTDLNIVIITAHDRGMGKMLQNAAKRIVPAFVEK